MECTEGEVANEAVVNVVALILISVPRDEISAHSLRDLAEDEDGRCCSSPVRSPDQPRIRLGPRKIDIRTEEGQTREILDT